MWFLFGEVSSFAGCLGWATLFYCGTPWAFHIIILHVSTALESTHYLCFRAKIRKKSIPLKTPVVLYESGVWGGINHTDMLSWYTLSVWRKRLACDKLKRAGYSWDIMWQIACLDFNPIMVEGYAALFSCIAKVQASDSMTVSMWS